MKNKSFMLSVLILAVGGLIAKVIGAVYRIPLTYVLGAEGLGIYQLVFPLYSLLIILSSSGVPTAIAKMVAERAAAGAKKEINKILKISLLVLSGFGLVGGLCIFFGADVFASIQGNPNAVLGFKAIAPAVLLVAILSCFRGYFQGLSQMWHTAASQVLEQLAKLGLGLGFAYMFLSKGLAYGAFGAVLGVTISEVVAVLYMLIAFIISKRRKSKAINIVNSTEVKEREVKGNKALAKELLKNALPITIASAIVPLTFLVDSLVIVNLLKHIGYTTESATILYGLHSGVVNSVINMPVVITLAVATAVVPTICFQLASGNKGVGEMATKAIRIALLIAFPCVIGFASLAPDILSFLYDGSLKDGAINELATATTILRLGSFSVLFLALLQVFTSILQSINKARIPVYSLLVASVVKVGLSVALLLVPNLNILGATIANVACFFIAASLNFICLKRIVDIKLSLRFCLFPLVCACVGMLVVILLLNWCLSGLSNYISLPITLLGAVGAYFGLLYVCKGADDFKELLKKDRRQV